MLKRDFIKEAHIVSAGKTDSYKQLLGNIEAVKKSLERNYYNMQFVEDMNLVDYYTYKIKSEEAQYDFLIKEAKKLENGTYL